MRKISLLFLGMFFMIAGIKAQSFALNGFGGYVFQDQVNFGNVYGHISDGGFWGASLEGISPHGSGIELLYQQQNAHVPLNYYTGGLPANKGKDGAVLSYIMVNGIRYLQNNPHVLPYFGLGIGVGIASPESGSSQSHFAWDIKMGVKLKTSSVVGFKLQAQLFSVVQAAGGGFYVGTGGAGAGVSTYSTIFQFGLVGGITFDFEKK